MNPPTKSSQNKKECVKDESKDNTKSSEGGGGGVNQDTQEET